MLVVLAAGIPLALATGPGGLDPITALRGLLGMGSDSEVLLARVIRMPRVLAALCAGAGLGAAGCLIQTLARNHLATPAILGLNEGATLAVMVAVFTAGGGALALWWTAPLGAAVTAVLLLLFAGRLGTRGYRVLVVGLALSGMLRSLVDLGLSRGSLQEASAVFIWSMGSLVGRGYDVTVPVGIAVGVLLPIAMWVGTRLALLQFDESTAATLGADVRRRQFGALLLAVVLTGLAVGIAGPVGGSIGFIALAAPIVAQRLAGPPVVPVFASALLGALLVLAADTLGRVVVAPAEIPAGAIASIVGGPFLLWVLFSESRHG